MGPVWTTDEGEAEECAAILRNESSREPLDEAHKSQVYADRSQDSSEDAAGAPYGAGHSKARWLSVRLALVSGLALCCLMLLCALPATSEPAGEEVLAIEPEQHMMREPAAREVPAEERDQHEVREPAGKEAHAADPEQPAPKQPAGSKELAKEPERQKTLSASDVAKALSDYARLGRAPSKYNVSLLELQKQAEDVVNEMSAVDVSKTLHAYIDMDMHPESTLLAKLGERVQEMVAEMSAEDVTNIIHAYAQLGEMMKADSGEIGPLSGMEELTADVTPDGAAR